MKIKNMWSNFFYLYYCSASPIYENIEADYTNTQSSLIKILATLNTSITSLNIGSQPIYENINPLVENRVAELNHLQYDIRKLINMLS